MKRLQLTKKQNQYIKKANKRWNLKSGATGSGKTFLDTLYTIPNRIIERRGKDGLIVLLGNTRGTLQRNIIEPLQSNFGTQLVSNIGMDNTAIIFGEKVYCLGADKVNQVSKIQGATIKYAYGDEMTTWNVEVFEMLKSRLRTECSLFDGTMNPTHPKHFMKQFIDSDADIFYQSYHIDDNPTLPPEFVKQLKKEYRGVYYDRYVKGLWTRAEGLVFKDFADDYTQWEISANKLPKNLYWIETGFDIGGNKSAYALTTSMQDYSGNIYVLLSKKTQAEELNMENVENLVVTHNKKLKQIYNLSTDFINSDHVDVIINTINDNTSLICKKAFKPPLVDRPFQISKLLADKKIFFVENMCDDLIDELQNLVFDDKSEDAIPLDDGTMQIDTWDSFIYSISHNWNRLKL